MKKSLPGSEQIIHPDGSVYHLKLKPEEVSRKIITVGDPERVDQVTAYFDEIECTRQYREFKTVTGFLGGDRLTVISTGIGTDNIDIVITELDSLFNGSLHNHHPGKEFVPLTFFRLGTSGSIHKDVPLDTVLISEYALGFDALGSYYPTDPELNALSCDCAIAGRVPYVTRADKKLFRHFQSEFPSGITLTMPGFYHPQGRITRFRNRTADEVRSAFSSNCPLGRLTNMEMETSGIYLLSAYYGHRAISVNAILANRVSQTFSQNPDATVQYMIEKSLNQIRTFKC